MAEEKKEETIVLKEDVSDLPRKILALINPKAYMEGADKEENKDIIKLAKEKSATAVFAEGKGEKIKPKSLYSLKLAADAPSNEVEPVYFWLLDYSRSFYAKGVEKLIDNFTSSPGSGHFSEMGGKATRMQEEGMKMLGMVNQLVKTILNLVYDLKEFEIRIAHYKDADSTDKSLKEQGMASLKQIWLDQVDMKKGRGSINQLTYESGFTTLRDLFMISNTNDDIKNNQIVNEEVKRITIPRLSEFLKWKEISKQELEKRFNIERSYLKSEVESLKLYTSWAMPYIKAAQQLRMRGFEKEPALVNAFNTAMFELTLLARNESTLDKMAASKEIGKYWLGGAARPFYFCALITLKFRGIPQKVTQQHYGFGGRAEITFDAYVLNDDEYKIFQDELAKSTNLDTINFIRDNTTLSLTELNDDIQKFMDYENYPKKEKEKEEKEKAGKKSEGDVNPFSALVSIFIPKKKEAKPEDKKKNVLSIGTLKPDSFVEADMRKVVNGKAVDIMYALYDLYKKTHAMASMEDYTPKEMSKL